MGVNAATFIYREHQEAERALLDELSLRYSVGADPTGDPEVLRLYEVAATLYGEAFYAIGDPPEEPYPPLGAILARLAPSSPAELPTDWEDVPPPEDIGPSLS